MRRNGLVLVIALLTLLFAQSPAGAIDVSGTPTPVTGNATWFSGLGSPYGGCGLPQSALDSQNFLALNVQNSPGNYTNVPRPISAANASLIGMFDNGLNCGRWVKVTIGNFCTGTNDGAPNMAFCRNGSWVSDAYNGATLDMVVADSCDDGNAWCKDDPYHVDLAQASLNQFVLNGAPVANMYPSHWNNRQVSWQFESAPNYTGDINIGVIQGAQPYWPAIAISHLPNGINGVQYYSSGSWVNATMDSDMGDDYIIGPNGATSFQIRVIDSSGNLVNNGEVYSFSLPSSCTNGCSAPYTQVPYTTSTGVSPSPSPPASPSASPTASSSPTAPASGSCSLTSSVVNSWPGGYQLALTVTNSGKAAMTGWTTSFAFADTSESVASSWNAVISLSGTKVTASNVGYNGSVAPGASTTFGMVVNGSNSTLSSLTCTPG
jgi:Cellulose binding domain